MTRLIPRSFLAAPVVSLCLCTRVFAIVLASGAANVTPPPNDAGFNNVGQVNGGSGVYLGNGWVITASHVGVGAFTVGGITYPQDTSIAPVPLQNTPPYDSLGKNADGVMFHLQSIPPMPSLLISQAQPLPGQTVTMVGYGLVADGTGIHYYRHDTTTNIYTEQVDPGIPGLGDSAGMVMTSTSQAHWGQNVIAQLREDWTGYGKYFSLDFATHFDHPPYNFPTGDQVLDRVLPDEAQGARGDSGGAAFFNGRLVGIMIGGSAPTSMPVIGNTAMFADSTYIVRLASYRQQILNVTGIYSPELKGDFNLDGSVSLDDVEPMLLAFRDLDAYKNLKQLTDAELIEIADMDGSGTVTNRDIQQLLNYIVGVGSGLIAVPEPATWMLAVIGGLAMITGSASARLTRRTAMR